MGTYRDLNDYELMYMVEENDDARELLFDKYRPIVIKMASKYKLEGQKIGLELDDLIQEGYIGLISAIKNYNPDECALFYTYAILSIKSKLLNCLRMYSCKKNYYLNHSVSLSTPLYEERDLTLLDFIVDDKSNNLDEMIEEKELIDLIKDYLYTFELELSSIMELMMNGFSNVDIAKLLDIPSKTVSNNLFSIRKKLREILNYI